MNSARFRPLIRKKELCSLILEMIIFHGITLTSSSCCFLCEKNLQPKHGEWLLHLALTCHFYHQFDEIPLLICSILCQITFVGFIFLDTSGLLIYVSVNQFVYIYFNFSLCCFFFALNIRICQLKFFHTAVGTVAFLYYLCNYS